MRKGVGATTVGHHGGILEVADLSIPQMTRTLYILKTLSNPTVLGLNDEKLWATVLVAAQVAVKKTRTIVGMTVVEGATGGVPNHKTLYCPQGENNVHNETDVTMTEIGIHRTLMFHRLVEYGEAENQEMKVDDEMTMDDVTMTDHDGTARGHVELHPTGMKIANGAAIDQDHGIIHQKGGTETGARDHPVI